ncbi:MAG: GNAT family N-acetyltransferase [Amylibacter sp.]|nr:GNAT family N-acetyltransferase [Amylibacter sp.]
MKASQFGPWWNFKLTFIRKAEKQDRAAIWTILKPIFRAGETYAVDPDISENDALAFWCDGSHSAFVAEIDGCVLGTYYICPNQGGNGGHICNCGFATHADARGKGVARAMLEHSLKTAPEMGFQAMQFNFVLANNTRAVAIWQRYGFDIIGRIPKAFNHPEDGLVDALVMHKSL